MAERAPSLPGPIAALGGAALAAFLAALVDAHWSWAASGGAAGSRSALLLSTLGLLAPVGLVTGGVVAAGARLLFAGGVPRAGALAAVVRAGRGAPAPLLGLATTLAVALCGGAIGLVVVAVVARGLFATATSAPAAGALAALTATGVAAATAALATASGRLAAERLGTDGPSPRGVLLTGAGLALLVLVWGIASGTTNGDGAPFGILGVLKREELDLRPVGLGAAIALAAFVAPAAAARARSRTAAQVGLAVSLVAIFLSLGLTLRTARAGLDVASVSLAIERGAPLAGKALAVLRRLTDGDRDGVSRYFGGGDCNDRDARIFPGADDVPANGVDEDCSGKDDTAPAAAALQPRGMAEADAGAATGARALVAKLPADLSFVLITIDTLRADVGFNGYARPVSRNLDRLAAESVVFENAYALASYTSKSLGPMLLGKYGSEASRTFNHFDKFGTDETFLHERLARAGFRTLSVQGHSYFEPASGFGRGFHELDLSAKPKVYLIEGDQTIYADKLTDAALRLLSVPENTAGRFHLWVHYLDVHADYMPHAEFDFGRKGRDRYDGEIAFTDKHVGRLLDFVREGPLGKRTVIVFTSDHGEAFGEHGMYRHGFELWEELVRVPLFIHVPGLAPRRVKTPRSIVDIAPTMVELLRLPPPTGEGNDFFSGASLLPDLVLPPGQEPAPRPILVDMPEGPYNAERQAFIHDGMKLITAAGRPIGLYDLREDPGEKADLLADAARAEPTLAAFKAFRRGLRVKEARKQK